MTTLHHLLGINTLPCERCAAHKEHVVFRSIDGVLTHDAVVRLNVTDHHVTLRAVDNTRVAVNVVAVVEFLKDVQNLSLRTGTRQRRANQTRIEQMEHRLASEAALLMILVRFVAECRTAATSHAHITLCNRFKVFHDGLQCCNLRCVLGNCRCQCLMVLHGLIVV